MAIVLSLLSALCYGISDFLGGVFSKRSGAWQTAVAAQISATVCVAVASAFALGSPRGGDYAWGALAGIGSGVGTLFLYRGLGRARMSVVAPLSAVAAALLPVIVGVATGDRPSTLAVIGIVCAFPAIWLISMVEDENPQHRGGVLDGCMAGVGFGTLFVFTGQLSADAGLRPVALSQVSALVAIVAIAVVGHQSWRPATPAAWRGLWMGPLSAAAVVFFLYATHHGLLSVVSVISSLYPASTVVLAALVLSERVRGTQALGLAFAAACVALVAAS